MKKSSSLEKKLTNIEKKSKKLNNDVISQIIKNLKLKSMLWEDSWSISSTNKFVEVVKKNLKIYKKNSTEFYFFYFYIQKIEIRILGTLLEAERRKAIGNLCYFRYDGREWILEILDDIVSSYQLFISKLEAR